MEKTYNRLLIVLSFIIMALAATADDVIVLTNGKSIKAKIVDVTKNEVRYKSVEMPDGPTYSVNKKKVVEVKYENGKIEQFGQQDLVAQNTVPQTPIANHDTPAVQPTRPAEPIGPVEPEQPTTPNLPAPQPEKPKAPHIGSRVTFGFADETIIDSNGYSRTDLAQSMQRSLSLLLSEINRAYEEQTPVNFDNLIIDEKAKRMFNGLWRAYPFTCNQKRYVLPALCDVRGFQVRGIDITKHSGNTDEVEDNDKELCVCFDEQGTITCINFAKSISFKKMYPSVVDKRRELEILQFIENFRCYYVNHDLEALETLFSEDAIIITGKVTMRRDTSVKDGMKFTKGTKYEVKDKKRYMTALASIFDKFPNIDVRFDEIKLSQHPSRENVYAVNLVQTWNSKSYQGESYSDIGYLHLLFDFPDHGDPRIHVRAWQPLDTDPDDIITIDSYDD